MKSSSYKGVSAMFRQTIILLIILLVSCDNKTESQIKFGCDPPCEKKQWLTFSYDCAYLFQDSTGAIKKTLEGDTLLNYTRHHNGPRLSSEDIKNIDQTLSCGLWVCDKAPTKKELYNPESIIVFVKSTVPVGYVTVCSKSNIVDCNPNSNNKEISVMTAIVHSITHRD